MASFARRGCVDGFFVSTKRGIAVVRLDGGFVRCLDDMIGIRRERFPFVGFVDIGDARPAPPRAGEGVTGERGRVGRSLVASQ
ncbi:hypothetical protein WK98_17990 [Burkholderia ubonensis]|nr:hypothetical protein WK98_17990 [Burkholderia ubonensis]KVW70836.1 hypothetical protein WK99_06930 [Burkholderia ubonensis]